MNITDEELSKLPSPEQPKFTTQEEKDAWDAYRFPERAKLKEALGKLDHPTAPPEQGTCYEHCEDHCFQVLDREARCYYCNQPAPDDWYDSEDV